MDTFAHAIWSYIIFQDTTIPILAVFFGAMPDLFSWTIVLIHGLITGKKFGKPDITKIPSWAFPLYGITHSIFVFGATILVVFLIIGYVPVYLWAWILHILIDIPTHSRKFLPTPFLWPISKWTFPGFNWGQPWFMILNWTAIIICFVLFVIF